MTVMCCLSHGTQDLDPDFLRSAHGFARSTVSRIAILYHRCAIAVSLVVGQISEQLGRRRTVITSLGLACPAIYLWAFGRAHHRAEENWKHGEYRALRISQLISGLQSRACNLLQRMNFPR